MLGADVSGSGAPLQMVPSPWTDPAAVVLAGLLPTSAIDDLTFVAAGRGVDGNGDDTIEVGFLSVLETQSQFELLFVLGGSSYTYVLDSPAALTNISGSGGGMSEIVSYMKLLAPDASGQLASYIVALNLSAQNAAFCEGEESGVWLQRGGASPTACAPSARSSAHARSTPTPFRRGQGGPQPRDDGLRPSHPQPRRH
jgi:hypothetical protein